MKNKIAIFSVFFALFIMGIVGGYFIFAGYHKYAKKDIVQKPEMQKTLVNAPIEGAGRDFTDLKIYYPVDGRLLIERRRVARTTSNQALVSAVVGEFFKGPSGLDMRYLPSNVRLLGVYFGQDDILYLDFSGELRREFRGGALDEFLLLKGLYDSLMANIYGIKDVKLLVEGQEVETIGGHLSVLEPLGEALSMENAEDTGEKHQ